MISNIKFMLLGIFLAVMSIAGFILADEIEIFLIIAIVLPIMAVWAFAKGFMGSDKDDIESIPTKTLSVVPQLKSTITNQEK